jgi:hypothetical protein
LLKFNEVLISYILSFIISNDIIVNSFTFSTVWFLLFFLVWCPSLKIWSSDPNNPPDYYWYYCNNDLWEQSKYHSPSLWFKNITAGPENDE